MHIPSIEIFLTDMKFFIYRRTYVFFFSNIFFLISMKIFIAKMNTNNFHDQSIYFILKYGDNFRA